MDKSFNIVCVRVFLGGLRKFKQNVFTQLVRIPVTYLELVDAGPVLLVDLEEVDGAVL